MEYLLPLLENEFYHIYNRGNNSIDTFFRDSNYEFFLKKLEQYLSPYTDLYAYCLLPNHFHLLIKIKDFTLSPEDSRSLQKGSRMLTQPAEIVSEQFRRFFLSYSKSIKVQEERTGSLFEKNFKRKKIDSLLYLVSVINYIHQNPAKHNITSSWQTYPYSSYSKIINEGHTNPVSKKVIELFGDKEEFARFHESNPIRYGISKLTSINNFSSNIVAIVSK